LSRPERVVLFDGVCVLCDGSMRFLLDIDRKRRLSFAPLQGETARDVLERHPEGGDSLGTVVYVRGMGTPDERAYFRSDAVIAVLQDVGGVYRLLASLFRRLPRRLRDVLYDWVARNRYRWFGKLDACRLPESGMAERFLP
jgi:predicted DCC family thiol-disulfide oxidoreductase YuxK